MDRSGELPTTCAGHLNGSEADDQGEALLVQDHLLQQQVGDRREQRSNAHTNILWKARAATVYAA